MNEEEIFEYYHARAVIAGPGRLIKSGKEASVYRCPAHPNQACREVAVKIYKDIETRSFKSAKSYLDGRIGRSVRKRRDILHMLSDPDTMQAYWVDAERDALERLYAAGCPVPRPLGASSRAIAMEFILDGDEAAPRLIEAEPDAAEAGALMAALLGAVRTMLAADLVHGDLSPYNVLVRGGLPVVIDFPQAADARYSSRAFELLAHDLRNVVAYFEKLGLRGCPEPEGLAAELWASYASGELYRERQADELARSWGLAELLSSGRP